MLIKLCGHAGWSEPLLIAYNIRQVFSRQGSNVLSRCNSQFFPPPPPRQSFPGGGSGRPIFFPGKKLTSRSFPWEKKITSQVSPPGQFFPQHKFFNISYIKCQGWGKNCAGPLFLHTDRSKHLINISLGEGKNWAGPFFPHPDKVKHQTYSEGYWVGENCCAYG